MWTSLLTIVVGEAIFVVETSDCIKVLIVVSSRSYKTFGIGPGVVIIISAVASFINVQNSGIALFFENLERARSYLSIYVYSNRSVCCSNLIKNFSGISIVSTFQKKYVVYISDFLQITITIRSIFMEINH